MSSTAKLIVIIIVIVVIIAVIILVMKMMGSTTTTVGPTGTGTQDPNYNPGPNPDGTFSQQGYDVWQTASWQAGQDWLTSVSNQPGVDDAEWNKSLAALESLTKSLHLPGGWYYDNLTAFTGTYQSGIHAEIPVKVSTKLTNGQPTVIDTGSHWHYQYDPLVIV